MFTLPPRPPKDYVIRDVTKSLQSSSQFSPDTVRVTQSNLGKYCYPIEYQDDEVVEKKPPEVVEPIIKEKMTNDAKALWVVPPGKDDFFIHDIYKKYSKLETAKSLDPRYKHKERIFNRSYRYELDCTEAMRLEKLRQKCERETEEFEEAFQKLLNKQKAKEKPLITVIPCKAQPPSWWQGDVKDDSEVKQEVTEEVCIRPTTYESSYVRWQEEPNLAGFGNGDPCKRKYEINLVGQPFKSEACNYYFKNYPPPDIKFIAKRFM